MKTIALLLLLSMVSTLGLATESVPPRLMLERPSMDRIQRKVEEFNKEIKRARLYKKCAYGTMGLLGGIAVGYVGMTVYKDWYQSKHPETDVLEKKPVEAVKTPRDDDVFWQDYWKERQERRTFMGRVKRSALDGVQFAFYTFIAGLVLNLFLYCEGASFSKLKEIVNTDESSMFNAMFARMWRCIDLLQDSLFTVIKDLDFLFSHYKESSEKQFREYFSAQLIVDHRSLVDSLENIMALALNCVDEHHGDIDKEEDAEDAVMYMMNSIDDFSFYLEELLNTNGAFDVLQAQRQSTLLFKKFSVNTACVMDILIRAFGFKVNHHAY